MISEILQAALHYKASDIHIQDEIYFRTKKKIFPYNIQEKKDKNLLRDTLQQEIANILSEQHKIHWSNENLNETSYNLIIDGLQCRISIFYANKQPCFAIRILNTKIPTLESIKAPKVLEKLCMQPHGLLLVCGATGAGKSTTLAAMLHFINEQTKQHILTIEDPIEYKHTSLQSLITQREIGQDSQNFQSALKASLRHDPDVILIGEILDSHVLELAIYHALSGHLVLASFHANSCTHAISRILGMCQNDVNIHANLAECLQGIVTQKLCENNEGLFADFEILVANPAIRVLIKEDKINQIPSQISMGKEFGMQHFSKNIH